MGAVTQRHSLDTWTNALAPSRVYEQSAVLQVRASERYAFIYFGRSFPLGATILKAELRLRTYALASTGTRSLTVRRTGERVFYSRLTWDNQPAGITGPGEPVTVTKAGALAGGTEWVFDVTAHLQKVADGADWSGWRVETDAGEVLRLYGVDSGGDYVPTLFVEWSDAPDVPEQMVPAGGRVVGTSKPVLRWDYTDVAGDTQMAALQVRISSTEAMTSPWDSGAVAASLPELDLASTSYPGVPAGGSAWWQVRVQDGAGLWSGWSDAAEFRYVGKGTLTLLSPAPGGTVAAPSPVSDVTPPVAWSLSGATQRAYRVRVWLNTQPKKPLWDSGRITAATSSVTVPAKVLRWDDRLYRVQVDVWDTVDRVSTPGSPAAYSVTTRFLLVWNKAVPGVSSLAARALDPWPHVELTWERSEAADEWVIVRGGEVVATLDLAETIQADGTHLWVDRGVPPRTELRYVVRPRVNGKTAWGNPTVLAYSEPVGIWLVNDRDEVCLIGTDDGSWGMGETSAIHEPIRGDRVVQIRQGMRGYEGSLSGLLASDVLHMDGISARDWRDAFLRIKRDGGATLVAGTVAFPVLLEGMVAAPTPFEEEQYNASFSFWQSGRLDWDALG